MTSLLVLTTVIGAWVVLAVALALLVGAVLRRREPEEEAAVFAMIVHDLAVERSTRGYEVPA